MTTVLRRICADLGLESAVPDELAAPPHPVPLPSRLGTGELAWSSVVSAVLAAGGTHAPDPDRIAASYRSAALLTIDGIAPNVWAPLSGFWRTSDGWVRTHANYPHHAAALRRALELDEGDPAAAFADGSTASIVARITSAGGLAVPVLREDPVHDTALRRAPLVEIDMLDAASVARAPVTGSLAGIRVLDLTRVIAGPVCTRTLAALGADVLRIDPPHLPEPEWQHLDSGHGKRSALLDARSTRFGELLDAADVVVLGYRPSGLATLGLSPDAIAERCPGIVIAQLSAWGVDQPERRGFDSLVQAESGIAMVESPDGTTPGVLPAQALDHSAGYLLAAAICMALRRRTGRTQLVRTSLRRVAAELLGMSRSEDPGPMTVDDPAAHTEEFLVAGHRIRTVRSALPGHPLAAPRPWGGDEPTW
ncbi:MULTISPECIES: CoA transferase [unclassified Microbacterium]|uniref:CoA transferase n=1 Tax=unclassified Microbacterium TaxID=2609290 RepID=UPI0012FB0067|nr:CoA transferase [Microbacterium sp. MAH-37]MVQ41000.1 carnitine dehydratase [Microbacterium sp. MAH-37]